MKKLISLALALVLVLSLTACGSKDGGDSADPNLGKYLGAEFSGDGNEWLSLDEVYDEGESYIELKSGGKGVFCLGGDATDIKWALESDGSLKLTRDSLESNGTLQNGIITLTDLWGNNVTITFVKEDGESSQGGDKEDGESSQGGDSGKDAPSGTGIVTEEQVQKGYVWMNEVNNNIFDTTYEEMVDYFGVDGLFVKEEYSDHMKLNYRYYKWISKDDDSHFLYVNFAEKEPGVFTVSAYNTSGFSSTEAIEKYLDAVKAEAAEADKASVASEGTKDFSATVTQFAHDDVQVKITTKIPKSGWSYDEDADCLVENEDPSAFGAGAIRFEVNAKVEDFDHYKDSFENYQEIADREISGITFQGRTYKYIGYDWIEYVAQIDDGRALSIGLTDIECVPGTAPDVILNSMTIK